MATRPLTIVPLRYLLLFIFSLLAVGFVVAPLIVVILNSFNSVAYNVFPPAGFSLRWYENLFAQTAFYDATVRAVILALLTTVLSLVIGTMAAYALVRHKPPGSDYIKAFLLTPLVIPKIVLGVAVFMFFVEIRTYGNPIGLLLTHTLVAVPFVVAIISASLMNFDWSVQEAAMDLGAGPVKTFLRIILPQISTSMVVAGVLAFITSFDQVETTIFLVRPGQNTLPIEMFIYLQKWQDPTIAALSTVLILFATLVLLVLSLLFRNKKLDSQLFKAGGKVTR